MEQVRMPSSPPQAAPKTPAAAGGGDKTEAGDAAAARKDGFALLLAALGGAAAQPLAASEEAAVPVGSPAGEQATEGDAAARDAALALGAQEGPGPGAKDAVGKRAPAADGDEKPAKTPADVSLQEHLGMLLNQGLHALSAQGLRPDSMVNETARIDAAVPAAAGPGARKAAGGAGAARSAAQAPGLLPQSSSPLAASGDSVAAVPGAVPGADGSATAVAAGQELLKSVLEKAPGAEARVSLQEGTAGARGAAVHALAPSAIAVAEPAWADRSRAAPAAGAQPQGGAASGGDAGMASPSLQQGTGASDVPGGAGQDGALPGSFMEQLDEQVAFWVHQKSQHAEFTLDRDGQPVQVQLSLSGDVAKVTFLTDHAAARQALDAGIEDLRERLHEQGLALADVNVGVAGGQGGGAEGQGRGALAGREGAGGTARVEVPERGTVAGPRAAGHRALDVFV